MHVYGLHYDCVHSAVRTESKSLIFYPLSDLFRQEYPAAIKTTAFLFWINWQAISHVLVPIIRGRSVCVLLDSKFVDARCAELMHVLVSIIDAVDPTFGPAGEVFWCF